MLSVECRHFHRAHNSNLHRAQAFDAIARQYGTLCATVPGIKKNRTWTRQLGVFLYFSVLFKTDCGGPSEFAIQYPASISRSKHGFKSVKNVWANIKRLRVESKPAHCCSFLALLENHVLTDDGIKFAKEELVRQLGRIFPRKVSVASVGCGQQLDKHSLELFCHSRFQRGGGRGKIRNRKARTK